MTFPGLSICGREHLQCQITARATETSQSLAQKQTASIAQNTLSWVIVFGTLVILNVS